MHNLGVPSDPKNIFDEKLDIVEILGNWLKKERIFR